MKTRKTTLALLCAPPVLALALLANPCGTTAAREDAGAQPSANRSRINVSGGGGNNNDNSGNPTHGDRGGPRGNGDRRGGGGEGGRRRMPPWTRMREPTGEEWKRAEAFMQANSPNRWKWYESIDDENRKNGMRRFLWWQYQPTEELRRSNRELYDLKVSRIRLDDQAFAAALDAKAPGLTDAQRTDREAKLKGLVSEVVKLDRDERRARIDRLKRDLEKEEKALAELDRPDGFNDRVQREFGGILGLADGIVKHRNRREGRAPADDQLGGNGAGRAPDKQGGGTSS